MTNYVSAHDTDASLSVDRFYDENGDEVTIGDNDVGDSGSGEKKKKDVPPVQGPPRTPWSRRSSRAIGLHLELSRVERGLDVSTRPAQGIRRLAGHRCNPAGAERQSVESL